MRIVHISNALQFDGTGHTNSTLDLAVAHADRGHSVTLVSRDTEEEMRLFASRFGIVLIDRVGTASLREIAHSVRQLRQAIKGADVIHLHTVRSMVLLALASPTALLRQSVATLHNPHQKSAMIMYWARILVALSKDQARQITRATFHLRHPTVIQNGTLGSKRRPDIVDVAPRELCGRPIVFAGALHPRKGIDILLRAMPAILEAHPDANLYVIGNRDNPEVEHLAASLGISRSVTFIGYTADPREYMKGADVFVLPSRKEGFGNVLTEARESGAPIVASRVGGIPEALDGGRVGILVEPADVNALATAIIRVLGDRALLQSLRDAGFLNLDRLRVARAADEYEVVYSSLAPRAGKIRSARI